MCWADKIVLVLTLFIGIAATVIWSGSSDPDWPRQMVVDCYVPLGLKVFLPLWIFLRAIDWMTGGPSRRRGWIRVRSID
jgi:hypothetical protein